MAEEESETPFMDEVKGRKPKRKRTLPPSWNMGRALGQLKRRNADLYSELQSYAKATKRKPTQVMEEALSYYIMRRHIVRSELTTEHLMEAWEILKDVITVSAQIYGTWANIMFSEQYQSMLELRGAMIEESRPPPEKPQKLADLEAKMLERFWNILDPLLDWTVESLMKSLAPLMGAKAPKLPKGIRIPVTITEEPEEGEEEKPAIEMKQKVERKKKLVKEV